MRRIDICYISDERYAKYAGVSIKSLLANLDENFGIYIHLVSDNIKPESLSIIDTICKKHSAVLKVIDTTESSIYRIMPNGKVYPRSTYLKLCMDNFFPNHVKKVLYIDCDTVITGNVGKLFHTRLGDNVIGAAIDIMPAWKKLRYGMKKDAEYINTGVMLIDLENWRDNKTTKKLIDLASTQKLRFQSADQDLINIVLEGRIEPISVKYNYTSHYECIDSYLYYTFLMWFIGSAKISRNEFNEAKKRHVIIHYTGDRPWYYKKNAFKKSEYIRWLKETGFSQDLEIFNRKTNALLILAKKAPLPIYYSVQWLVGKFNNRFSLDEYVLNKINE